MVDTQVHLVIDNGSGFMKGGFSGEEAPRSVFPTISGIPKESHFLNIETPPRLIGQEAIENLGTIDQIRPIENGIIVNWEEMEKIWHHLLFKELCKMPEHHNIILTDAPSDDEKYTEKQKEKCREKMVEIFFEKFNIPGLFISMTSLMSMYASGHTAGIVVDSGETMTNFVPVFEGFAFPNAIIRREIGGRIITTFLQKILEEKRCNITNVPSLFQKINDIKEKYCYVAYDYDNEIRECEGSETRIKLPDGQELNLGVDKLKCPESLFKPSFVEKNFGGIHEECYTSIQKTDTEIRKDLYSNIVLSGGNTLFQGLPERLSKEIQKLTPSAVSNKVKVVAMAERKYATWIGASIFSSLSTFQCMWITKAEYLENKAQIVHEKCF